MKKKLLFVILLLLLSLVLMACTQNDAEEDETDDPENEVEEPAENEDSSEEEIPTLDEEQAKEVLHDYRDGFMSVIENTEDDGALADYESKEALKEEFMNVMSEDLADSFVSHYFEEDNGKVYVVPTEAPVWFEEDSDFSLEQVNDLEYEVTQEQSNELIGNIRMTYVITSTEDSWIVNEVRSEDLNGENSENGQDGDQASDENNTDNNTETDTGEITEITAEDLVREHLNISQNSDIHVVMDHKNEDGNFVVQVYELVSNGETSHTATIGWYIVDQDDGTVEEMM
ncbi:hypothetical protein GI584_06800 [Gracilibacillus salitolerans]|uniref:DUF5105 domain-containing protein n=1 Tax=Gracilibacillus salitolerans TaxID=2663022 RepID=A0A5Q2TG07_9BACI|nr:hypothetical protein [Gracilibacillus salitolerans]QGH33744.1 hypothetical protein GI584_06800 [Gracilibacillus salitolerans]